MCVFASHHFIITETASVEIEVFQRVFGSVGDVHLWINLYIWRFQQLSGTLRCDIQHGSRPGTPYERQWNIGGMSSKRTGWSIKQCLQPLNRP